MSDTGAAFRHKFRAEQGIDLPEPPPDGGYLVLNPHQFANKELRDAIANAYPNTGVIENKPLPIR